MSKRYSGKSFKDSSVMKKPKLSLKEKRKLKKEYLVIGVVPTKRIVVFHHADNFENKIAEF